MAMILEMLHNSQGGAATVEEDGVAVGDEGSCGLTNPAFFLDLPLAARHQGQLNPGSTPRNGSTMGANDQLLLGQRLQIGPDGDFGHTQRLAEFGHRYAPRLLHAPEDFLPPFF
jgi:hypothetical protein